VRDASSEGTSRTSAGPEPDDDTTLINAVRSGDTAAYGVLYERHLVAAKRVASTARPADRDDLVAESFTQVLRLLRTGRGPDEQLRPYLLTTLRNALTDSYRRDAAQIAVADVPDVPPPAGENPADTRAHALVATTAFRRLPQRWRCVLWYTEIEQRSPAEVAELLELTPNGVAALAYRAREALRQAYLDQYLPAAPARQCRPVVEHLAKWVRHKVSAKTTKQIQAHLGRCRGCRRLASDLEELNQQLPMLLGPLVAGAPLAIASVAGTAGTAGTTGTLVAATGVADAATTGLSIATWTAAKTLLAGAAVVATTSLGAAASAPAAAPRADVVTQPAPREQPAATHRTPLVGPTIAPITATTNTTTTAPTRHQGASDATSGKPETHSTNTQKKQKQPKKKPAKKAEKAKGTNAAGKQRKPK